MRDKENLFNLLREAIETFAESAALDEFIRKINREMPPIEVINDTHQKFDGLIYRKHKQTAYVAIAQENVEINIRSKRNFAQKIAVMRRGVERRDKERARN